MINSRRHYCRSNCIAFRELDSFAQDVSEVHKRSLIDVQHSMEDGGGSAQQERILCQNFVDLRRYRRSSMAKSLVATSTKSESNFEVGLPRTVRQQPCLSFGAKPSPPPSHLAPKCQELSHAQISDWWRHRWGRPRTVRGIGASSPLSFFVAVGAIFFTAPLRRERVKSRPTSSGSAKPKTTREGKTLPDALPSYLVATC